MALGELMPATPDNPRGYFEAIDVVEAHNDILKQLDLDWTCPPPDFDPQTVDLTRVREQFETHRRLPEPWGIKDPRSMFMLKAWAAVGLAHVRFVGVLRPEPDVIRSLVRRDGMDQLTAENIVMAHHHRMREIASQTRLPIIEFSNDAASVLDQTRRVARALDLRWDEDAARGFFEPTLVRNRSAATDSPDYRALADQSDLDAPVTACDLTRLTFDARFPAPLNPYIGPWNGGRRNQLWGIARFSLDGSPRVVELIPAGARPGRQSRPGVHLDVVEIAEPLHVGLALRHASQPNGVVASGLLDLLPDGDLETFFREIYLYTDQLTEAVFDIVEPEERAPTVVRFDGLPHPPRGEVLSAAERAGWDVVLEQRLTPSRVGMKFRKRMRTDSELLPVVTDLLAAAEKVRNLDALVRAEVNQQLKGRATSQSSQVSSGSMPEEMRTLVARAESAERELARLKNRRSVRVALSFAKPFKGLFRVVRRWRR